MITALRTALEQLQNHFASGWKPRALQHPPAGRILPRKKCGGLQAGPEPAGCSGLRRGVRHFSSWRVFSPSIKLMPDLQLNDALRGCVFWGWKSQNPGNE